MAEGGSDAAGATVSFAGRMHALRESLYGTLFSMQKWHSNSPAQTVLGMAVSWLQIMSFLFASNQ